MPCNMTYWHHASLHVKIQACFTILWKIQARAVWTYRRTVTCHVRAYESMHHCENTHQKQVLCRSFRRWKRCKTVASNRRLSVWQCATARFLSLAHTTVSSYASRAAIGRHVSWSFHHQSTIIAIAIRALISSAASSRPCCRSWMRLLADSTCCD